MDFYNILITWYLTNKRDLPWRNTTNPYYIWLSEIILQQTRVAQGLPYFEAFTKQFPKVSDLANASQEQVLKTWQGLGYYSRARNLHDTAKHIYFNLNGKFPDSYKDLLKLKGVGQYTAAAIASFAFNENIAVVDGNVFRVLARIFGLEDDISKSKTRNKFQDLANSLLLDNKNNKSYLFNQAIMDFGALQCIPKKPNCLECPFKSNCVAFIKDKINELPVKLSKTKVTDRYFDYLVLKGVDQTLILNKREGKGIWQGLYEFPLLENDSEICLEEMEELIRKKLHDKPILDLLCFDNRYFLHKLSHQNLYIRFWKIEISENLRGVAMSELDNLAYPIVLVKFIEKNYDKF